MFTECVVYIKVNQNPIEHHIDGYYDLSDGLRFTDFDCHKYYPDWMLEESDNPSFDLKDPYSPLYFKKYVNDEPIYYKKVEDLDEWGRILGPDSWVPVYEWWDAYEQVNVIEKGASSRALSELL